MMVECYDTKMTDIISNYEHIVFGGEHYNPLGVVRSLGEYGVKPIVIAIKSDFRLMSSSKYIKKLFFVNSIEEGFSCLKTLELQEKKAFVYCSDDRVMSYFDEHLTELPDNIYSFHAHKPGMIQLYMQKIEIQKLAEAVGFKIPKSIIVKKGEIPSNLHYPIITKAIASTAGAWKKDVFICNSDDELKTAYSKIVSSEVTLQEYISKDNELCLDGISYNNGDEVFCTISSTYDYILPDTYSPLMTITNFDENKNNDLFSKLKKMFSIIGFEGIFSVEFLVSGNELYFLEINFRNSTWSYASTCVGMNLPLLWAYAVVNNELPHNAYRKIPDNYRAVVEIPDFRERVFKKKMNIFAWLKDIKHCQCKFLTNKKDRRPVYSYLFGKAIHVKRKGK